jgi:SAM-dependent methyltransferase
LDETARESGLRHIRHRVGKRVLTSVHEAAPPGDRLLDVGSAHGWFVALAEDRGFDAVGLEPDEIVAATAQTPTRLGYFPEAVAADERFDVITFNDVLEHVPDPRTVIAACRRHLKAGGVLSINIPCSSGLLFRTAVVARRRGRAVGLFDRLWQVGLPSPHLWFFDVAGLSRLCVEEGFDVVGVRRLPTLSWRGLWDRAHMDRSPSPLTLTGVAAAGTSAPVLNRGGDIVHLVLRRRR